MWIYFFQFPSLGDCLQRWKHKVVNVKAHLTTWTLKAKFQMSQMLLHYSYFANKESNVKCQLMYTSANSLVDSTAAVKCLSVCFGFCSSHYNVLCIHISALISDYCKESSNCCKDFHSQTPCLEILPNWARLMWFCVHTARLFTSEVST